MKRAKDAQPPSNQRQTTRSDPYVCLRADFKLDVVYVHVHAIPQRKRSAGNKSNSIPVAPQMSQSWQESAAGAKGNNLSEKPYLIWEVIHLFLHVLSRPESFRLTRAILAHFNIISCHTT